MEEGIKEDVMEEMAQIFLILTREWVDDEGIHQIGVPEGKLLDAFDCSLEELQGKLEILEDHVNKIGLELLKYSFEGNTFYCVRSTFIAPNELSIDQLAVLGSIIAEIEKKPADGVRIITTKKLQERLVTNGYYSPHKLNKIINSLEQLGYVQKDKGSIKYGAKTLIEFNEISRKEIMNHAGKTLI